MNRTDVAYDKRSIIINGKPEFLISGAIHYPRSTPRMWQKILDESKKAGLNCIETYVFWEGHEPQEGHYDFSGRFDICHFLDLCHKTGLYTILRIGPYICAEWNFGGFPWWLLTKPGMATRTWNKPFMDTVEKWVRLLLDKVRDKQFTRGGSIILVQMENEYPTLDPTYAENSKRYLDWNAGLARSAGVEVPLVMCNNVNNPDVIETLNGFSVWRPAKALKEKKQPLIWTELWTGWYDTWNIPHHNRLPEDIIYEVLRFAAVGGTGINYYMWHGGTNFGRDAMYMQTTSYDFNAPLDEYGMPTTKSEKLKVLHSFLKKYSEVFLYGEALPKKNLTAPSGKPGDESMVYTIRHKNTELTFLCNGSNETVSCSRYGHKVDLPRRSALVLENGKTVFKSWDIKAKSITRKIVPGRIELDWKMLEEPLAGHGEDSGRQFKPVPIPHNMLLDTRDETDFGWYRCYIDLDSNDKTVRLRTRVFDILSVWVNGGYMGTAPLRLKESHQSISDSEIEMEIFLKTGRNELLILVAAMGMVKHDYQLGKPLHEEKKGILSEVTIDGQPVAGKWEFSPGLYGESRKLFDPATKAGWHEINPGKATIRWYRADFNLKKSQLTGNPCIFEPGDMFKGQIWVNGISIGRFWQEPSLPDQREEEWHLPHVFLSGRGNPPQKYYHIPSEWLKQTNTIVGTVTYLI